MRPCGCDWDVAVFGHAYCWNTLGGFPKHVTCRCATCTCDCHKWTGDHGTVEGHHHPKRHGQWTPAPA